MGILKRLFESGTRAQQKREKFRELEEVGDEEEIGAAKATWLVSRGNYYGDKGMLDEALQDFDEALQLQPDHLAAHLARVVVHANRGEIETAQRLLDQMPDEMKVGEDVVGRKDAILVSAEVRNLLDSYGLRWAGIADDKNNFVAILASSGTSRSRMQIITALHHVLGLALRRPRP